MKNRLLYDLLVGFLAVLFVIAVAYAAVGLIEDLQ